MPLCRFGPTFFNLFKEESDFAEAAGTETGRVPEESSHAEVPATIRRLLSIFFERFACLPK